MNGKGKRRWTPKRFAMIPCDLFTEPAVSTLDHAAYRVLTLLAGQFRGRNNGALGFTAQQASECGIASDNTFYRALRTLSDRGLIELTYPASRVPPRPAMYALAWLPLDDTEYSKATRTPSFSYRTWRPEKRFSTRNHCGQGPAIIAVKGEDPAPTTAISAAMEPFSGVPQPQPSLTSKRSAIGTGAATEFEGALLVVGAVQ